MLDVAVSGDGADGEHAVGDPGIAQPVNGVDVDQHGRARQPKAHRRYQALAAGKHTGVAAVLLEMAERFVLGVSPEVFEGCWNHVAHLPRREESVAETRDSTSAT